MRHPSKPSLIQYWHEERPPDYIAELLDSFKSHNSDMEHLVFNASTAEEFIEAHYGPREIAAFRTCAVPAMQADYFRYCAGHALGGVCVDADFNCARPLLPLVHEGKGGHLFRARGDLLDNSLFSFGSPGHSLCDLAREVATIRIEERFPAGVAMVTGPGVFTSLYWLHRQNDLSRPALPEELRDLIDDRIFSKVNRLMRLTAEAVGDRRRLEAAFEDVQISSELRSWVRSPRVRPPYKDSESHWSKAATDIYRRDVPEVRPDGERRR